MSFPERQKPRRQMYMVGGDISGGGEEAVLLMARNGGHQVETPESKAEREACEAGMRRAASVGVADWVLGHCGGDRGACRDLLLTLGLIELETPAAAPPPQPADTGSSVYWRKVAEAYLEARKLGPYQVHERMAAMLGEEVPARQMGQWGKNRTGRAKAKGWLKSARGLGGGSVAGPRLEEARAEDAPP